MRLLPAGGGNGRHARRDSGSLGGVKKAKPFPAWPVARPRPAQVPMPSKRAVER